MLAHQLFVCVLVVLGPCHAMDPKCANRDHDAQCIDDGNAEAEVLNGDSETTSMMQSHVAVDIKKEEDKEESDGEEDEEESDDDDKSGEEDEEESEGHGRRQLLSQRSGKGIKAKPIKAKPIDLPGKDLINLGKDFGKLMKKFGAFMNSVPNEYKLKNLVKTAVGGIAAVNTRFVEPALDGLEASIKEASSKLPEFGLPVLGCTVQGASLVAINSTEDASWIDATLQKIEEVLNELSEKKGMEVLKAGKKSIIMPAFAIIKTKVVPFVTNLLAFVREKAIEVLNKILDLVLPDPPSLLESDVEQTPAQIYAWLKTEIPSTATAEANAMASGAMSETYTELSTLTKCRGGSKPRSLTNPQKLEYLWPTIMTKTIFTISKSLINMVVDEMQPHILKFVSGMASVSDSLANAISTGVGEVPAIGPLIGLVVNFVVQTFNKILWVPFAPALIDCSLRQLIGMINDEMTASVAKVVQRVANNAGASSVMSTADLPRGIRGSPIAKVLAWVYNQALPDIIKEIQAADSKRAIIAAAAQGFQCSR